MLTTRLGRRVPRLVAFAVVLLVALHARPSRANTLDWSSFDDLLPDCDIVRVEVQHNAINPGAIEIDLDIGTDVVRWKGVGIGLANGKYWEISTEDQHRSNSIQFAAIDVMTAQYILLGKAKDLGLHTGMYEVHDMSPLRGGDRVKFHWVQDNCLYVDAFTHNLPDWLPTGKQRTLTITVQNNGSTWRPYRLLALHIDGMVTQVVPITTEVPQYSTFTTTVTFKAPSTSGVYPLEVRLFQGSAKSWWVDPAWHTVSVSFVPTPPPPPPPPPPPLVTVPRLVGLSLADAEKALASLVLTDHVFDRDSSVPPDQQVVQAQSPMPGSRIQQGASVALYLMAPGYSSFEVINCSLVRDDVYIWELVGDSWQLRGSVAPQWDDSGTLCPGDMSQWFEYPTTSGAYQYFVVVDPLICSFGNNPDEPSCRLHEAWIFGNPSGLPFDFVVD